MAYRSTNLFLCQCHKTAKINVFIVMVSMHFNLFAMPFVAQIRSLFVIPWNSSDSSFATGQNILTIYPIYIKKFSWHKYVD